jgi:cellulose synthase/poly-beta-1,6-N-acetylglucosamine synthase-like glycosyltransferase
MLLTAALAALSVPVTAAVSYLSTLVLLSGKRAAPEPASQHKFRVIVPAHNEELGITETVRSLQALEYPRDKYSVWVVADNCTDNTASAARAAGAEVLERTDATRRGKGYALLHAFERLPSDVDAVVVIDADTLVSRNLLGAFSARIQRGASAVQADYAVRNPHQSWRTRLMAVAFGSFHIVRSRGRERLGLSAGLRGNGMCFTREILERVPHDAFSIVEDVEYGIRLGEQGCRVFYADEAHVYGEMVASAASAGSQRKRWEGGRQVLAKAHAWRLLRRGVAERNAMLFDLGVDLLVPPLSRLAVGAILGWSVATGAALVSGGTVWLASGVWAGNVGGIIVYVLRGWSVSGTGVRGLRDLALAPAYVIWKLTMRGRGAATQPDAPWVRTTREAEAREVPSS